MKHLLSALLLMTGLVFGGFATAENFVRLASPIPQSAGADKVVVQQFLWHQCIHCYHLEGAVQQWLDNDKPDYVVFERLPVAWGDNHLAQGAFYTAAKALHKQGVLTQANLDTINDGLFDLHFEQKRSFEPANVLDLFKPYGIQDVNQLLALINSPEAADERTRTQQLTNGFKISTVPVFIVAGKYLVNFDTLSSPASAQKLFATINQLAASERPRPLITPFTYHH